MTGASEPPGSTLGPLAGLLAGLAVATAVLHAAGTGGLSAPPLVEPGQWEEWLAQRDPLLAAVALIRLGALATCWYLLITAGFGFLLRLLRAVRLVSLADRLTLPAVHRLLVSAAGVTLASGVSPSLALVPGPQLPAAVVRLAPSDTTAAGQFVTTTTTTTAGSDSTRPPPTLTMHLLPPEEPAAALTTPPPAPTAEPEAPARAVDSRSWRVAPGECFWSIAEDVLTQAWGRPPSDAEVIPYWTALIEANRGALADGANPDLVFPGQVFALPDPPLVPGS